MTLSQTLDTIYSKRLDRFLSGVRSHSVPAPLGQTGNGLVIHEPRTLGLERRVTWQAAESMGSVHALFEASSGRVYVLCLERPRGHAADGGGGPGPLKDPSGRPRCPSTVMTAVFDAPDGRREILQLQIALVQRREFGWQSGGRCSLRDRRRQVMKPKMILGVGVISFGLGALLAFLPGRATAGVCNCVGPSWGGSPPGCYSWGQGFDAAGGNPVCCERTGGFTTNCTGLEYPGPKLPPLCCTPPG